MQKVTMTGMNREDFLKQGKSGIILKKTIWVCVLVLSIVLVSAVLAYNYQEYLRSGAESVDEPTSKTTQSEEPSVVSADRTFVHRLYHAEEVNEPTSKKTQSEEPSVVSADASDMNWPFVKHKELSTFNGIKPQSGYKFLELYFDNNRYNLTMSFSVKKHTIRFLAMQIGVDFAIAVIEVNQETEEIEYTLTNESSVQKEQDIGRLTFTDGRVIVTSLGPEVLLY